MFCVVIFCEVIQIQNREANVNRKPPRKVANSNQNSRLSRVNRALNNPCRLLDSSTVMNYTALWAAKRSPLTM